MKVAVNILCHASSSERAPTASATHEAITAATVGTQSLWLQRPFLHRRFAIA